MSKDDLRALALTTAQRARARARAAGITQEQIATAVSASQSQVSRILAGKSLRRSKLFDEICIYVNSAVQGVSPDLVRTNDELIGAIASVWDRTAQQATAIANVIRSLSGLASTNATISATNRDMSDSP